jgi:hypothetical protein
MHVYHATSSTFHDFAGLCRWSPAWDDDGTHHDGTQPGYPRIHCHQSLDQQHDALTGEGIAAELFYPRTGAGLAALIGYARGSDAIVVIGIDRT